MRRCKNFLYILLILSMMTFSIGEAEEIYQECSFPTGKIIGFPTYVVSYEVSDPNIAEVFRASNGEYRVKFISPGDVYVRVTFYSGGKPAESQLYLCHITGAPIASSKPPTSTSNVDPNTYAQEVLRFVNIERAKYNLRPLRLAEDLNKYAEIRARECIKKFSHTRPNGTDGVSIVPASTYDYIGENINGGAKSPEQVVYEWMHSPAHRDNILFSEYDELGVGYVYDSNSKYKHYWLQLFRLKKQNY